MYALLLCEDGLATAVANKMLAAASLLATCPAAITALYTMLHNNLLCEFTNPSPPGKQSVLVQPGGQPRDQRRCTHRHLVHAAHRTQEPLTFDW
jgi:hypothetical protein